MFTLSLMVSIQSPLTISLMTLSRTFVVISPFSLVIHNRHFIRKVLIRSHLSLSVISCLIVIILRQKIRIIPTNLCSSFFGPENSVLEIRAIILILAILQALSSFFIAVTYYILLMSLLRSNSETKARKSKHQSLVFFLLPLSIVTLSNLLSWIPFQYYVFSISCHVKIFQRFVNLDYHSYDSYQFHH